MNAVDLKRFPLLAKLSDADRETLCELLEESRIPAKRTLFRESSEADGMFMILSGQIRLTSSRTSESASVGAGQVIGGLSLVVVGPREATAKIEEAVELLFLPRTSFRRLVDDAPRAAARLLESLLIDSAASARELLPSAGDPWESR